MENKELAITSQANMLFAGTSVVTGRAKAYVTSVALETEIGKIASTIHNTKEEIDEFIKELKFYINK